MCRNIKKLYNFDTPATDDEIRAAAVQYVRKISGSAKPSRVNEHAFERAVQAISATSQQLLADLVATASPRNLELETAGSQARNVVR